MSRIIEAKAVLSAEDRTGKVFDNVARKFKEIGKGAKVSAEVDRLTKSLKNAQAGLQGSRFSVDPRDAPVDRDPQ